MKMNLTKLEGAHATSGKRSQIHRHLNLPLLVAVICGVVGCGGPEASRLADARAQIQVAWDALKPSFSKRYENLPAVIAAYDESFGFKDGAYTGDPRAFGWSNFDGQGIDIYSRFPQMRVSNSLKDHLKGIGWGSLEAQVNSANGTEQDLLPFIVAASSIQKTAQSQELEQAKTDVSKTQADLASAAGTINALIVAYNEDLDRYTKQWFSKRLDLSPIGVQLMVTGGVPSANRSVAPAQMTPP